MVQLGDGVSASDNDSINFSWVMKDSINESKSCSRSLLWWIRFYNTIKF